MKCPCEGCISLAICVNQDRIQCPSMWEYIGDGEFNYIKSCHILGIHKAYQFYVISYDKGIEFVKDKLQMNQIIYDRHIMDQRILVKIRHYLVLWLVRSLIQVLRAKRYLERWYSRKDKI